MPGGDPVPTDFTPLMKRSAKLRVFKGSSNSSGAGRHEAVMIHDGSLGNWMQTLVGYVRSGKPDLTNRQMALLLVVCMTPGPHTVRGLAQSLGVSKPVVTRALNTLGSLGYLRRERDEADRRNVFVAATDVGVDFLEGFGGLIEGDQVAAAAGRHLGRATG